jgi:hypothetical protein
MNTGKRFKSQEILAGTLLHFDLEVEFERERNGKYVFRKKVLYSIYSTYTVYEGESVNRPQIDLKRKTCDM